MSDSDNDKLHDRRRQRLDLVRRILSLPLTILVLIFFLIEDLFLFGLRPLFRVLGRLLPFITLGSWLKRLNPYAALVVFVVPFILLEPVKIFSIFWIGIGHFVSGTIMLVTSYVLSLFIVERLFHVTRDQLLSIAWFAWGYNFVMKLRQWAFERLEASSIWRATQPLAHWVSTAVRDGLAWLWGRLQRVTQPGR